MGKSYFKELQNQIEYLSDMVDIKDVEYGLLKSELVDVLTPMKLLQEQSNFLIAMLEEIIEFEKKKPSDRIKASKNRVLTILGINTQLSNLICYNHGLKLFNIEIVSKLQLVKIENAKLKRQLENINKAENF